MSGYSSSSYSEGTALGSNETLTADGIALGNAVKLRGHIDFVFHYEDEEGTGTSQIGSAQDEDFAGSVDMDFLIDLSPITAEVHLNGRNTGGANIEQAFGRYSVNQDFHVTFGRQLTALGYESDEAPGLLAVTDAYVLGGHSQGGMISDSSEVSVIAVQTRRNYKDGVRLNYNNGMFGFIFGLHDGYWAVDDYNGGNMAIDLAASVMFFPGLEARIGYAHESLDKDESFIGGTSDGDIDQFNAWISYNPGALTLAAELDVYSLDLGSSLGNDDYFSMMLMASYQFTDFLAATFRYSHEDYEDGQIGGNPSRDSQSDRITLAMLFSLTQNFDLNVEYSTASIDSPANSAPGDFNEFLVQGLITY